MAVGRGDGPIPARICIVGEAWGEREEQLGRPFVGASGFELDKMLHEAGILRSECFVTNVVNRRPPDNDLGAWIAMKKKDITPAHVSLRDKWVLPVVVEGWNNLVSELEACRPAVIIAFGNTALWALTGEWGILKWRGSRLRSDFGTVIPTIHPAAVLREWSHRAAVVSDLRRAAKQLNGARPAPELKFIVRPSFDQVLIALRRLAALLAREEVWIDLDLETRVGHIACCGLSWSRTEAICIPFMCLESREGYWNEEEEAQLIWQLYQILTHPRVRVRWQNGLYDAQYIHRWWHFVPRGAQDTMISQHALFSDLPKSLAFQASLYCEHYVYWKDEGKTWHDKMGEDQLWRYNCLDCVNTREVGEVELQTAKSMGLERVHEFQQALFWPVLAAMLRGLRVDESAAGQLAGEIQGQIELREKFLFDVLGHALNINSPAQMCKLFYDDLAQPRIMTRAKKGSPPHLTCDDEALTKIGQREPLLKPLVHSIADIRTLGKFLKDFILAKRDVDGRMRCSFNIGGSESGKSAPKTYRLSSSTNAFGSGANLQTIPSEKSKSVGKWEARGSIALLGDPYQLPNLRSMFQPDPGFTFFDMDLDRADIQVMAWDADEPLLKAALRAKADIHLLNAFVIDGRDPPPLEELVETHPKYPDHRGPMKFKREFAKVFAHATDYLGKPRTVAAHTGRSIMEIERAQKIYLGTYKGIERWQKRIIEQVTAKHYVENAFNYKWFIFDRIDDSVMPEAVAWIPQSTVSVVINRIWMNLFQGCLEAEWDLSLDHLMSLFHRPRAIQVLLQVHDSLAGQFPTHRRAECLAELGRLSRVVVPYPDPLVIPTGISTSERSWGECK